MLPLILLVLGVIYVFGWALVPLLLAVVLLWLCILLVQAFTAWVGDPPEERQ